MAEEMTTGLRDWRGLYESAVRVKEISPWEWMTETDVFGVQSPESGELGFVSVMGMLGEHYAVSLYLGSEGMNGFLDLQEMGPFADPGALIPQIQASLENREELDKRDREVIKELGLKFRGRNAWPMFRSYRPSLFPWFLDAGEVRFLSCALEQLADVAPRFREDSSLLEPSGSDSYLLRAPRQEGGEASLGRRFDGCASTGSSAHRSRDGGVQDRGSGAVAARGSASGGGLLHVPRARPG